MISESRCLMSRKFLLLMAVILLGTATLWAGQWTALGPDGGDVRSLTYDPQNPDHIFLGTSTGTLFVSNDGGHNWARLTHLGAGDDYVIDHLVINPQDSNKMYAAVWSVENQQTGDLLYTTDGGKNWETTPEMHGKSIRAMTISTSDSKTMVVGALDGVFRTTNGGKSWTKISSSNQEIHNIESVAVDPKNSDTVYAGTWHLAWKTENGGANWHHINKGMIDDSDVFSIIVDTTNPSVVYASACSGIYKSDDAGEMFHKVQGIPFSARRTRVLKQDPTHPEIVYAGTTEGLWQTSDAGKTWKRTSNPEVVVNDVMVDPRNSQRVLLATDRGGVLASDDSAHTFTASNHGYTHRYVTAIVADKSDFNTIYVGVVNDREMGGVFASHDGGQHWTQKSAGLDGRDVFTLQQTANGELVAGTNRGMFMMARNASTWTPINTIVTQKLTRASKTRKATKTDVRTILTARVNEIDITPARWLAATSAGIYTSSNQGKSWSGGPVMGKQDFVSVKGDGELWAAATRNDVLVSTDSGKTWKQCTVASYLSGIHGVTVTPDGQIMIASREGAYRSPNSGAGWEHMQNGLPDKNISSITYDTESKRLMATSTETGVVFESDDNGQNWRRGPDSGYPLRRISVVHGHYVGATPFDGVIVQTEGQDRDASASVVERHTN